MNYGLCPLSVVPIRSSAADKSEMVSQLLFGELVEILEQKGSWWRIRCLWDNYLGWVDRKQIAPITPSEKQRYESNIAYSLEIVQGIMAEDFFVPITLGATLSDFDGINFFYNNRNCTFSGQVINPAEIRPSGDLLLKIARRYLHAPYLWGGRSPLGIDCSGFTQMVFKMMGIALPRDAVQQVERGRLIDFIEQGQAGDLAFFENRKGRITHVGLLLPDGHIIHASGRVRIDRIDHYGIFNEEDQRYTHKLRVVKRVLSDEDYRPPITREVEVVNKNQVELF